VPYLVVAALTLVNLLQASVTELTSDEGYYWYLSTAPAWGHYDHPPLLPLLMHWGDVLVGGPLGVRLFGLLTVSLGLVLLVKLLEREGPIRPVLYLLVAALPLLNYLHFVMFPDTPLLGLSMAYLYLLQRFLDERGWGAALGLGVVLALMLYAKYHAVLLLALVVLSRPALLADGRFVASLAVAALLYLPHLGWQLQHDWVSVRYHLVGRATGFRPMRPLEYLVLQPLVLLPALVFVPLVRRPRDAFERALRFVALGIPAFFLLASTRDYVHAHWTSLAIFPLLILGYRHYVEGGSGALRWLALPVLALVVLGRLQLAVPLLPLATFNQVDWQHGRAQWAQDIAAVAGDRPVVFEARLRDAPLYAFYAGRRGYALYPGERKKSEYEVRHVEDSLQGQRVLVIRSKPFRGSRALATRMGRTEHYLAVDDFASYQDIRVTLASQAWTADRSALQLAIVLANHRATALAFAPNLHGEVPALVLQRYGVDGRASGRDTLRRLTPADRVAARAADTLVLSLPAAEVPAAGRVVSFGFDDGVLSPSVNSPRYTVGGAALRPAPEEGPPSPFARR
jgi:hypothetical protein